MSTFDALTFALENWFEKPLGDLPKNLRVRVEKEFFPMEWGKLSADQRRSVALQMDFQHDPATAQDQTYWRDFSERLDALKRKKAEWETVATPTVTELTDRESRLAELNQKIAGMLNQQRLARGDYCPMRESPLSAQGAPVGESVTAVAAVTYLPYPKALHQLTARLDAKAEELAAWIFLGPEDDGGGIAAYLNANELDPPPRFSYVTCNVTQDYMAPLMACWFKTDDVDHFEPAARYLVGTALIERWGTRPGVQAAAFIQAKIAESRLLDMHPIFGRTRGSDSDRSDLPPLDTGLFALSEIKKIEKEDFPAIAQAAATPDGAPETSARRPCAVFLAMENLRPDEMEIVFVGDNFASELSANSMLEVTARKVTRRIAWSEIGLVDRRVGTLNSQGGILLGMAKKMSLTYSVKNSTKIKRLRDVFRQHFGIKLDPFEPHRAGVGWAPLFKITDKRGAATERAKREAERRTQSFEQLNERGVRFTATDQSNNQTDDDNDAAGGWLRENDPDA